MGINIAILDDEQFHIERARQIVNKYGQKYDLNMDEYDNSKDLIKSTKIYDILLVDMELNETGKIYEGMEVVKAYRETGRNALIIFVTTHDELARDGYKVNPFRYVYKGELEKELSEALEDAFEIVNDNDFITFFAMQKTKENVFVRDILYFETYGRQLKIHTKDEVYITNIKINELLEQVENREFCLVHRSYVVNMKYAAGINRKELHMKNGEAIPIGRTKYEEAEKIFWDIRKRQNRR